LASCEFQFPGVCRNGYPPSSSTGGDLPIGTTITEEDYRAPTQYEEICGAAGEQEALADALETGRPDTGFSLMRDLQDLWLMVNESFVSTAALLRAARALGDRELEIGLLEEPASDVSRCLNSGV